MNAREGTLTMSWRLVVEVEGVEQDPDNLLEVSRQEIIAAIDDGEVSGEITERVIFPADQPVPAGVAPDPEPEGDDAR